MMNIEILESYEDYSAIATGNSPMNTYWIFAGTSSIALGVSSVGGERGLLMTSSAGFSSSQTRMFAVPVTKLTASFSFVMHSTDTDTRNMFEVVQATGLAQMGGRLNDVGKFVLTGEGGLVLATSEMNLTFETVYRCCLRLEWTATNKVNCGMSINGFDDPGLTKVDIDLQDQSATTFAGWRTQTASHGAFNPNDGIWDWLHTIVGTGECVDWGPLEVIDSLPTSDVAVAWTRSAGASNFGNVDDATANGDTDYNSSETVNQKDIFGYPVISEVPESVVCVAMVGWAKKEDSATRRWRQLIRLAGVDYPAADAFAAESYQRQLDTWELNPVTGLAWTPAEVAAGINGGYEYLGV